MTKSSPPKKSRLRRARKAGLIGLAIMAVLLVVFWFAIDWFCIARPPDMPSDTAILTASVRETPERREIGKAWLAKRDGIRMMHLEGDPFTRGYSNVMLTQPLLKEQEDQFIALLKRFLPSKAGQSLMKKLVLLHNRNLPAYVKHEDQMEILGLSHGYTDYYPEMGPVYHRLLNYHAAHDISHVYMDHPLVGCTSFAAWGRHTTDGHLIVGRNFDFDAVRGFDENKIVMRVKPDKGLAYLSVAWPGMIGVVTGLNEKRIFVALNASQSVDTRTIGTPVSLVMRDVMQHAATLEEAVEIIRASQVFVNDSYLVADGKAGVAVVVEKTPARCVVRRAEGEVIVCANHFLSEPLKSDADNISHMEDSTTVARYDRMEMLLKAASGHLTPAATAKILRDHLVTPAEAGGGLGNAAALNPLIATHSVVADATRGILWVSAGPHQLGAYVPFTVEDFEKRPEAANVPADPLLASGGYKRFGESRAKLIQADALLDRKETDEAVKLLEGAAVLNPDFYLPYYLLGKIAFERRDWQKAGALLEKSLARYPPFRSEREKVQEMLGRIEEQTGKGRP